MSMALRCAHENRCRPLPRNCAVSEMTGTAPKSPVPKNPTKNDVQTDTWRRAGASPLSCLTPPPLPHISCRLMPYLPPGIIHLTSATGAPQGHAVEAKKEPGHDASRHRAPTCPMPVIASVRRRPALLPRSRNCAAPSVRAPCHRHRRCSLRHKSAPPSAR